MQVLSIPDAPQHRTGKRLPWVVRWRVGDKQFRRSHKLRGEAGDFISRLRAARGRGELFDAVTGLPASMGAAQAVAVAPTFLSHAQDHIRKQWPDWAPKSRKNAVESLLGPICTLTDEPMPRPMASAARSWLRDGWLRPVDSPRMVRARSEGAWVRVPWAPTEAEAKAGAWLTAHSLALTAIKVGHVEAALAACASQAGARLAPESQRRVQANLSHALRMAACEELIPHNPVKLLARKRLPRSMQADPKATADLFQALEMAERVRRIASRQGELYYVFLVTLALTGVRTQELALAHRHHLDLPEQGWGELRIFGQGTAAGAAWTDDGRSYTETGQQKRREAGAPARRVPLPPELVALLRHHCQRLGIGPADRLFPVRGGGVLTVSNKGLARAWGQARAELHPAVRAPSGAVAEGWLQVDPLYDMTFYDLRHTAASAGLRAGVPVAELARRLGHTPHELLTIYAGFLSEDVQAGNKALSAYYTPALSQLLPAQHCS